MSQMMKEQPAIHHFLFGIFPILFLYAHNSSRMPVDEIAVPLIVVVCFTLCALFLLRFLIHDGNRRALVLSFFLVLVFSYGHVAGAVPYLRMTLAGMNIRREEVVFFLWCLLFLYGTNRILRMHYNLRRVTNAINIVAIILVTVQTAVGAFALITRPAFAAPSAVATDRALENVHLPDVYYIIVDGYGRSDVLERIYQYDNHAFLDFLRDKGFYVADSSRTNYCQTLLSLAASLNTNYLHKLAPLDQFSEDRRAVLELLQHNRVFATFKRYGYSLISFASGYTYTEFTDVDCYLTPGMTLSEFDNVLLTTTPVPFVMRLGKTQYDFHRERIDYILDKLPHIHEGASPRFVFTHLICPHPPFVFGENGRPVARERRFNFDDGSHYYDEGGEREEYVAGYHDQIAYLSRRLQQTIDELLAATPENPPVIILQADHGPGAGLDWSSLQNTDLTERFGILNAYYFPGNVAPSLYEDISPVNSFRIVFNTYLGTDMELLPDICYHAIWRRPYNFFDVTDRSTRPLFPGTLQ